jgi:prepilin-type N-terminal cleavage/methylation domain-containing protein
MKIKFYAKQYGFSLVELAIVLVILGFVLSTLLLPLRAQREQAALAQTENTLENAKQAILGYAQSKGQLPCPATANGTSVFPDNQSITNPVNDGICKQSVGFLPATTLGIQPTDLQGFAVDAWNNRIRYAVTQADNPNGELAGLPVGYGIKGIPDFTKASELQDIGISRTNPPPPTPNNSPALNPDLKVSCGQVATAGCVPANLIISNAVVVIYSTGPNGALPDAQIGADEVVNKNTMSTFYSRIPTAKNSAAGEFDDIVTWISPYVLYNSMIQAGQLH